MVMAESLKSKERKGNETDLYDDFCDLIRSGFELEREIKICLGGCLIRPSNSDDEELMDFEMEFKGDTYFDLRDQAGGKVIPTCIKYASYLLENASEITCSAEEMRGFCLRFNPLRLGEELSDSLGQSVYLFEEYVRNAEETEAINRVMEACNGGAIPAELYRMLQVLDREIMKDCM